MLLLLLRALYSFVASIMSELRFLNKAVALVLGFVGGCFSQYCYDHGPVKAVDKVQPSTLASLCTPNLLAHSAEL